MIARVEGKLRELRLPGFLIDRLTRSISQLNRWEQGPAGQSGV
jgi:hypothetical protein